MAYKCPHCGRFVSRIQTHMLSEHTQELSGVCYTCGRVKLEEYDQVPAQESFC
jgi:DNA-directed RNA polymerase subunit RPC12/RpoP